MNKKPSDSAIEDSEFWHFYALDHDHECPDVCDRLVGEWQFDGVKAEDLEGCSPTPGVPAHKLMRAELAKWLP
ncbi:hypothetical protein ABTI08_20440, partial [Acinetobacter baumannii]